LREIWIEIGKKSTGKKNKNTTGKKPGKEEKPLVKPGKDEIDNIYSFIT
jgi:hypothetical protein